MCRSGEGRQGFRGPGLVQRAAHGGMVPQVTTVRDGSGLCSALPGACGQPLQGCHSPRIFLWPAAAKTLWRLAHRLAFPRMHTCSGEHGSSLEWRCGWPR